MPPAHRIFMKRKLFVRVLRAVFDIVFAVAAAAAAARHATIGGLPLDNLLAARSAIAIRHDIGSDRRCAIRAPSACDDDLCAR